MIIISPYNLVSAAVTKHKPASVISILEPRGEVPALEGVQHLKLALSMSEAVTVPQRDDTSGDEPILALINFAEQHDWTSPLLVHCRLGLCRSPAAAFVIMCALSPDREEEHATTLSQHLDGVDPCLAMIMRADRLLDRDGAMIDAITQMDCGQTPFCGEMRTIPFTPTSEQNSAA